MDCDPIQSTCSAYLFAYLLKSLLGSEDQLDPGGGATDKVWNSQGQVLNCYESNYNSSDCIFDIYDHNHLTDHNNNLIYVEDTDIAYDIHLFMQVEITHILGCFS